MKKRNEDIRQGLKVANIEEKMKDILRKHALRKVEGWNSGDFKRGRWLRIPWIVGMMKDIRNLGLDTRSPHDRESCAWRKRIYVDVQCDLIIGSNSRPYDIKALGPLAVWHCCYFWCCEVLIGVRLAFLLVYV